MGTSAKRELCEVCSDPGETDPIICVVEEAYEVGAIERTGQFQGLYHVLGGTFSLGRDWAGGVEPRKLSWIGSGQPEGGVSEVIVATNASVEGEATAVYLENVVRPLGPQGDSPGQGDPRWK